MWLLCTKHYTDFPSHSLQKWTSFHRLPKSYGVWASISLWPLLLGPLQSLQPHWPPRMHKVRSCLRALELLFPWQRDALSLLPFGPWPREAVLQSPYIKQQPPPHFASSTTSLSSPLPYFSLQHDHHLVSHMFNHLSAYFLSRAHDNISILRQGVFVMVTVVSPVLQTVPGTE